MDKEFLAPYFNFSFEINRVDIFLNEEYNHLFIPIRIVVQPIYFSQQLSGLKTQNSMNRTNLDLHLTH